MYCPKCKENFEEGSRRFCPTDGARLMSDTPFLAGRRQGAGIFSNLIAKTEVERPRDESFSNATQPNIPQFVITEAEPAASSGETNILGTDFFEIEEAESEPQLEPIFEIPTAPAREKIAEADVKPAARK